MAEERVQRRLAAILAADMAGYTRLMSDDEEATLLALTIAREIIDGLISDHRGRVFGSAGDSVIAEFASPVDAVRCAADIQRHMEKHNADLAENRRMYFRIGVNLGDVMVKGGDLLGEGVNVAARLETLAEPGSIYISDDTFRQIRNKLDFPFEDLGERDLKNVPEPVRVHRIRMDRPITGAEEPAPVESQSRDLPEKPSIAVLPFVNMSNDAEQEYFSDGITEDVITDLSKISALFVIARNSTFAYKGKSVKVADVCRELGVRYVLEGSVRKVGNRVRINA